MVFGLLIPAMSIYGDTNRTLAEGEEVRSIAELPGNPLDYLATKADLANLEVRLVREMADFRNEITERVAGLPTKWEMWSATGLIMLGLFSILLGLFSLYRQGRT